MENSQQPSSQPNPTITQPESQPKKRKATETRSIVWDHFEKIFNDDGIIIRGKCLYCMKEYKAESKKHGTATLKNHMEACLKNPHAMEMKQKMLAFKSGKSDSGSGGALTSWVFNQEVVRKALAKIIIIDELSFRFVEGRGFKQFMESSCPRFKIPSRWTVNRDIFGIYCEEKTNLKKLFKSSTPHISLTTDTWTSVQIINYMCITAHFIDHEWKLNKKVISFVPILSHKGESIAKALETCLIEWGVKNIFTITVDNASSNDVAIGFMKHKLVSWGGSSTRVDYVHMRCIAHILNLVVQDGLKLADASVKKIRDCVRWVRGSPSRLHKFREFADLLEVEEKSSLCLGVPTRWNSTYMMLRTAIAYKGVFEMYQSSDNSLALEVGSVPSNNDWLAAESLVVFLKTFYEMTIRISRSLYVTSNSFLSEISDLSCIIDDMLKSVSEIEKKFGKYWGDPEKMNMVIFFANILDPRDKVEYMEDLMKQMYGEARGKSCFENVKSNFTRFFEEYVLTYSESIPSTNTSTMMPPPPPVRSENVSVGRVQSRVRTQLKKQKLESGASLNKKSELEVYLNESTIDDTDDFDILRWWKVNSERFPILSKVARDILAVPISIVASESTFSTSGRVLDNFRSSLTPKIVEAFICTQDWLRGLSQPIAVEENIDEIEKFEQELTNMRIGTGSRRMKIEVEQVGFWLLKLEEHEDNRNLRIKTDTLI
ncbi:hypothetical protein OSB04_023609 [Centaurea solstitialis]|uniref:BED-type domain-containing protein n=1 Tax=Centaurea solstitialis TaxID=347529 RepID=A0AA38W2F6_9ASTR|nr:hypothetical protein OSB04_023609 [Centaurea solstitialis]